jgi:flavin reductase (DIM6/NTAB) family NADH-FMN oxidoreductase RutF
MFDPRELRSAFGTFMTGVTVVTTVDEAGRPRGFTANSFTSVSLDPPLLLICIGKQAASCETFCKAAGFAVNVLAESQKPVSNIFASKRPDKFAEVAWRKGPGGSPLIEESLAWFDCARHQVIDAGDHVVIIGAIEAFGSRDANPLGYARGGYVTLGLEQAAVNAAASGGSTIVGAILECEGRLVLVPEAQGARLRLPQVGTPGAPGSASLLAEELKRLGLDATLGFLFAVFDSPATRRQSIYYRGDAALREGAKVELRGFDDLPWERLPDEATRSMLRRYVEEREFGRFRIYSGDDREGELRPLA